MKSLRESFVGLGALPLAVLLAVLLLPSAAIAQEDNQRCEGKVTDHEGNPLKGVKITFLDKATAREAQPVTTSRRGIYAHNTLRASTSPGWEIRAVHEGWLIVQITALTQSADGNRVTDETYMVGENQEGLHAVRVPPQARSMATSRGQCVVDFVMAPKDRFNEIFHSLRGSDEAAPEVAQEGAPDAPAGEDAPPAAPPARGKSALDLAREAVFNREYEAAVEPARKAVEEDPASAEAHYRLGQSLLKTDKIGEAEPALKKAHELDPSQMGLNFELGMLFIRKERPMQAIPYFEAENASTPGDPSILQNLGKLYSDTGQHDKAIAVFEQLVGLEPDRVEFYGSLAAAYGKAGNPEKERETYERMGAADPSGMAFYNLGTLMFNNSEMESAAAAYEKAIEQAPDHALAHLQLGLTYVNLARFKDAARELETFLKLDPKSPRAAEAKDILNAVKGMGG